MASRKHSHRRRDNPPRAAGRRKSDPVHDAALDALSEDDKAWFAARPDATERFRVLRDHELCDPAHWPACVPFLERTPGVAEAGGFWIVRVTQIKPGLRQREFGEAGSLPVDENGDIDVSPEMRAMWGGDG